MYLKLYCMCTLLTPISICWLSRLCGVVTSVLEWIDQVILSLHAGLWGLCTKDPQVSLVVAPQMNSLSAYVLAFAFGFPRLARTLLIPVGAFPSFTYVIDNAYMIHMFMIYMSCYHTSSSEQLCFIVFLHHLQIHKRYN